MKKIIVLTGVLISFSLSAQVGGIDNPITEFIPNTPNAAEMTQYGKIEIGEFTGTMQHSVPLYEIIYKDIKVPITLNYNSNGVNIDKHESSVGIDWGLNAGGVIMRSIMDLPDEAAGENIETLEFPSPPYPYGGNMEPVNQFFNWVADAEGYDLQPDIFTFNILGYTGKFYLKNPTSSNPTAILINPSPVKIEIDENFGILNNQNSDFKIILPNGMICWFGGPGATDHASSRSIKAGNPQPPSFEGKNAFYLTKIESPLGVKVDFDYFYYGYERFNGVSQAISAKYFIDGTSAQAQYSDKSPVMHKSFGNEVLIKTIYWGNNKIEFEYNQKLLDKILIKNNGSIVNGYSLEYKEEIADSNHKNDYSYCRPYGYDKRYFLEKVKYLDKSNSFLEDKLILEYYDPSKLPPRFSFSRDYWGYFNGKKSEYLVTNDLSKFNVQIYGSFGAQFFNLDILKSLFKNTGKTKNTDPNFAIYGLLKKIIYPTKGWSEIEYEANSYYGEVIYPGEREEAGLQVITEGPQKVTETLEISSFANQEIFINGSLTILDNCEGEGNNPGNNYGKFTITDQTNNAQIVSKVMKVNSPSFSVYANLEKNHSYEFELWGKNGCSDISVSFSYEATPPTIEYENIPFGGMRVKKIINKDDDGSIVEQKNYYYGNLDCLECSEALFEYPKPGLSFHFVHDIPDMGGENMSPPHSIATLSSSSLNGSYFSDGSNIVYPMVSIQKIDYLNNRKNGLIVRNFNTVLDQIPITNFPLVKLGLDDGGYNYSNPDFIISDWINGTPYINGFGNGELISEQIYNEDLNKVQEQVNHYKFDDSFEESREGFNISVMATLNGVPLGYNVNKYFIQSKRYYNDYTISKNYSPNGVMETRTDYFYDGVNKLLKSKEATYGSDGSLLETTFSYPQDLLLFKPKAQELTEANRISDPLIVQRKVDGILVSLQETEYADFDTEDNQGNIILPKFSFSAKGNSPLEKDVTYDKYDEQGNLLQYTLANGIPVSIIWGYDGQYPIAKVEGKDYTSIQSAANTLITASNNGSLNSGSFDALRNLDDVMVTGYIYKPLVGVTQIIQPNGQTENYEYDDAGRLKLVKDHDGNVLKKVEYNYQPQ